MTELKINADKTNSVNQMIVAKDSASEANPLLRPVKPKVPWNKGKLVGQKAPLKQQEIWSLRVKLDIAGRTRDLALFNLAFDSKLRGCDLVSIRISDISQGGRILARAAVVQKKTKRPVQFEITAPTRAAVSKWIEREKLTSDQYLFPSLKNPTSHLSTRQYAKIVHTWVELIALDSTQYGTHSMRRTKPTLIYKKTKNLRAVQLLLGHTKLDSTVRYLGVKVPAAQRGGQAANRRTNADPRSVGGAGCAGARHQRQPGV